MAVHNFPMGSGLILRLLPLTIIAVLGLTACNSGNDATTSGGSDSGTKAAACARVVTIRSELSQIQAQIFEAMNGGDASTWGTVVHNLNLRKNPLNRELAAQNKVCKG